MTWRWVGVLLRLPELPEIDPDRYVRETRGGDWVEHLDGAEWFMCDPPPRRHRCWAQSRWFDSRHGDVLSHCACGGWSYSDLRGWSERNTHTAPTAEERAEYAQGQRVDALLAEFDRAERAGDRDRMMAVHRQLATLLKDGQ